MQLEHLLEVALERLANQLAVPVSRQEVAVQQLVQTLGVTVMVLPMVLLLGEPLGQKQEDRRREMVLGQSLEELLERRLEVLLGL